MQATFATVSGSPSYSNIPGTFLALEFITTATTPSGSWTLQVDTIVNGGWGAWSDYTATNSTCIISGGTYQPTIGFRSRTRQCNNPAPQNGGATCPGSSIEFNQTLAKCDTISAGQRNISLSLAVASLQGTRQFWRFDGSAELGVNGFTVTITSGSLTVCRRSFISIFILLGIGSAQYLHHRSGPIYNIDWLIFKQRHADIWWQDDCY